MELFPYRFDDSFKRAVALLLKWEFAIGPRLLKKFNFREGPWVSLRLGSSIIGGKVG